MRLGVFLTWAAEEAGGPEVYEQRLVRALAAAAPEHEYHVFCLSRRAADSIALRGPNVRFHVLWPATRLVSIPVSLPLATVAAGVDLMHVTAVPPPFSPTAYVFTMHCFSTWAHPEFYPAAVRWRLNPLLERGMRQARVTVCVSQTVRDLVAERFRLPADRLAVAYHGVGEEFRPLPSEEVSPVLRTRYGIDRPYMLFAGKLTARKNVVRILEAYASFRHQASSPLALVLVGKPTWKGEGIEETIARLDLARDLVRPGYVRHEDMPALYGGAELFVFPSLWEGFGLPIIEAMACGCPVVTSNLSAMPEVAGGAALLVDPYSVDEIAEAMWRVASDPGLRESLRRRGLERAQQFTWAEAARQTLAAYRQAL